MSYVDLRRGDCLELIKSLPDESVDLILTDPPYNYLSLKWDESFNEGELFKGYYRVLKNDSSLVIFGRGVSLAKWVVKLDEIGFKFKEELVWDKGRGTNFQNDLPRQHELAYIFTKGKVRLNKQQVDFSDSDINVNLERLKTDVRTVKSALGNTDKLAQLERFINEGILYSETDEVLHRESSLGATVGNGFRCRTYKSTTSLKTLVEGKKMTSIIKDSSIFGLRNGKKIHPTQKPIKLLTYILKLVSNPGDVVLDTFMGSGSTGVACINNGRDFIGMELDDGFFDVATNRLKEHLDIVESDVDLIITE